MSSMANKNTLLWKTVVLEEDRKTDTSAIMSKWEDFFGINAVTDLDDYIYTAVFSNNSQASYPANMMSWTNINSAFKRSYIRSNWGQAGFNNASVYANAGTRIDIYKLPKYD